MHEAIPEHTNSCKWCGEDLRGGGDFHPECEEQYEAAHANDRQVAAERDGFDDPRDRDGYAGVVGAGLGMHGEG